VRKHDGVEPSVQFAGLDLIADQQCIRGIAGGSSVGEVTRRWHEYSGLALDGLDEHCCRPGANRLAQCAEVGRGATTKPGVNGPNPARAISWWRTTVTQAPSAEEITTGRG
jgi:hypothetical protein